MSDVVIVIDVLSFSAAVDVAVSRGGIHSALPLKGDSAASYAASAGAGVGDQFKSLIHTCELNGGNPFDYLSELQRHAEELKYAPAEWMPWTYRQSLARVVASAVA